MKKFKRVLSLLLVICTIIPLIITTEITSSAATYTNGNILKDVDNQNTNWKVYSGYTSTLESLGYASACDYQSSSVVSNDDGSITFTNSGIKYRGAGLSTTYQTPSGVNGKGLYVNFTPSSTVKSGSVYSLAFSASQLAFSPVFQSNNTIGYGSEGSPRGIPGYNFNIMNTASGYSFSATGGTCVRNYGDAVAVSLVTDSSNADKLKYIFVSCVTTVGGKIRGYDLKYTFSTSISFARNSSHTIGFDVNGKIICDGTTYDSAYEEAIYFEEHKTSGTTNYRLVVPDLGNSQTWQAVPSTATTGTTYDFISCTATGVISSWFNANTYGWSHYTGSINSGYSTINSGNYYTPSTLTARTATPSSVISNILNQQGYISFGTCTPSDSKTDNATFTVNSITTTKSGTATEIPAAYYGGTVPTKYSITVNSTAGGYASADYQSTTAGKTVTLTATPDTSSVQFTGWTTTSPGVTLADSSAATTTFKMPANDVIVQANFNAITYPVNYYENKPSGATGNITGMPNPTTQSKTDGATYYISSSEPQLEYYTFKGWNTSSDGTGTSYDAGSAYVLNQALNLYAQWEKETTYTVNYDKGNVSSANGILSTTTVIYPYQTFSITSTIPTSSGKTFIGWNSKLDGTGDYYPSSGLYKKNENVTLYAQWATGTSFNITVNFRDGKYGSFGALTNSDIFKTVAYSSSQSVNITPSESGEHDENGGTANVTNRDTDKEWIEANFKDSNGTSLTPAEQAGETYVWNGTKTGPGRYKNMWFRGWNTEVDGSGIWVKKLDAETVAYLYTEFGSSVSLHAVWGYPVVWNTSGAKIDTNETTSYLSATQYLSWTYVESGYNNDLPDGYMSADRLIGVENDGDKYYRMDDGAYYQMVSGNSGAPADPYYLVYADLRTWTTETRSQYMTYLGMVLMPNIKGGEVEESTAMTTTDKGMVEMIALWTPSITYYANNGTNNYYYSLAEADNNTYIVEDSNGNYHRPLKSKTVSNTCKYTNGDKVFLGWNTKPNGTGETVSGSVTLDESLVLYAQWGYSVSFDLNGVSSASSDYNTRKYNDGTLQYTLPQPPSSTGFLGWKSTYDGQTYVAGATVEHSTTPTDNITYIAQWDNLYNITFDKNTTDTVLLMPSSGGTITDTSVYIIPDNIPTRLNYKFVGWDANSDGTPDYQPGDVYYTHQTVTLKAVWQSAITVAYYPASLNSSYTNQSFYGVVGVNGTTPFLIDVVESSDNKYKIRPVYPAKTYSKKRTFTNWKSKESDAATYQPDTTYTINSSISIVPTWTSEGTNRELTTRQYLYNGSKTTTTVISGFELYRTAQSYVTGNETTAASNTRDRFNVAARLKKGYTFYGIQASQSYIFTTAGSTNKYSSNTNLPCTVEDDIYIFQATYGMKNTTAVTFYASYNSYNINLYTYNSGTFTPGTNIGLTFNGTTTISVGQTDYQGHALLGWAVRESGTTYDAGNDPSEIDIAYTANMTQANFESFSGLPCENGKTYCLYPIFQSNTVSFDNNGKGGNAPTAIEFFDSVTLPGMSSTQSDTFLGWSENKTDDAATYTANQKVTFNSNKTLYAIWGSNHTVSYNSNGGDGTAPSAQTKNYGSELTLSDGTGLSKAYNNLTSWKDNSTGKIYALGATLGANENLTADIELYAQWEPYTYTVVYHPNGGDGEMPDSQYSYGTTGYLSPNIFTNGTKAFVGWSENPDESPSSQSLISDKAQVLNWTDEDEDVIDLYAIWEASSYKISYKTDARCIETEEISQRIQAIGGSITLTSEKYTAEGYTQIGWATVEGGEKVYDFGESHSFESDTNLYPAWQVNEHTFNLNLATGGSLTYQDNPISNPVSAKVAYGTSIKIQATPDDGYTFDGWSCTDITLDNTNPVSFNMPDKAVTITPKFKKIEYDVDVEVNPTGTATVSSITSPVEWGTPINLSLNSIDESYEFVNWSVVTESSQSVEVTNSTSSSGASFTMPKSDVTVTANLKKKQVTVNFSSANTDFGTVSQSSASFDYGTVITRVGNSIYKVIDSVRDEYPICTANPNVETAQYIYNFVNWNGINENQEITVTDNTVSLEAQFSRSGKPYQVTVSVDGGVGGTAALDGFTSPVAFGTQYVKATAIPGTGYDFDYWTVTDGVTLSSTTTASATFTMPAKQVDLVAHFKKQRFAITYNVGGGGATGTSSSITDYKEYDVGYTLRDKGDFSRTGYTQDGWSTESLGTKVYELNASYSANSALTLYPHWVANTTSVSLNANGGSSSGSATATYDSTSLTDYVAAQHSGILDGYYTASSGGTKVIDNLGNLISNISGYTTADGKWCYTSTSTLELFAHWDAVTYTVTYALGTSGGSGTGASDTFNDGDSVSIRNGLFTKNGYVQTAWSTNENGSTSDYNFGETYSGTSITLYPYWSEVSNPHKTVDMTNWKAYLYNDIASKMSMVNYNGYTDFSASVAATILGSDVNKYGGIANKYFHIVNADSTTWGITSTGDWVWGASGFVTLQNWIDTVVNACNATVDSNGKVTISAPVEAIYNQNNFKGLLKSKNDVPFNGLEIFFGLNINDSFAVGSSLSFAITDSDVTAIPTSANAAAGLSSMLKGSSDFVIVFSNVSNASGRLDHLKVFYQGNVVLDESIEGIHNGNGDASIIVRETSEGHYSISFLATRTSTTYRTTFNFEADSSLADVSGKLVVCSCAANNSEAAVDYTLNNLKLHNFYMDGLTETDYNTVEVSGNYTGYAEVNYVNDTQKAPENPQFKVTSENIIKTKCASVLDPVTVNIEENGKYYIFKGWYNGDTKVTSSTPISADTTLTAKWDVVCSVTLNKSDHGTDNGFAAFLIGDTAYRSFTAVTAVSGYGVNGYYTAASDGTKVLNADGTFAATDITGYVTNGAWSYSGDSLTLYAQYYQGYRISFYNGSTFIGSKTTQGTGSQTVATLTKEQVSPAISGLVGWKLENAPTWSSSEYLTSYFYCGDEITVTGDVNLKAVTTTGVSLKFYSNGGDWGDDGEGIYRFSEHSDLSTVGIGEAFYFPTATSTLNRTGYRLHTSLAYLNIPRYYTNDGQGHGVGTDNYGYGDDIWPYNSYELSGETHDCSHLTENYLGRGLGGTSELYAVWDPIITYNMNDGSGVVVQDFNYITCPDKDKDCTQASQYVILKNGDMTMYNSSREYEGRGLAGSQTIAGGANKLIPNYENYSGPITIPSRTGYTLSKWNTEPDGSGTNYSKGTAYTVTEPLTLYAVWTPKTTTVTINANGGTGGTSITATYGQALPVFTPTSYTGRILDGYYTASSGGTKVINANGTLVPDTDYADANGNWKKSTKNEFYAQWSYSTTSITIYHNNDSVATTTVTATYDSILPSFDAPTWGDNRQLKGYYTATTGDVMVIDKNGNLVRNVSGYTTDEETPKWNSTSSEVELYARWEIIVSASPIPSGIAANISGGGPKEVGSKVTLTTNEVDNYSFIGWYNYGASYGTDKPLGEHLTYEFTADENVNLVAYYTSTKEIYNLHIVANSPSNASYTLTTYGQNTGNDDYEFYENTDVTITFDSTDTYEFKYWTNSTGKIVSQDPTFNFVMVGDTTLTAIFTDRQSSVKSSMVVYETSYGQVIRSDYYSETDTIVPAVQPIKVGYEFQRWEKTPDEIKTLISGGQDKMIVVKPIFEAVDESFNVTVKFVQEGTNTALDGQDDVVITQKVGSTFKYYAPETLNDMNFICWRDTDNKIVSYSYSYIAYPSTARSITLKACYSSATYAPNALITMTSVTGLNLMPTGVKMSFEATRSLPTGYTIVEQGFMVYKGSHDQFANDEIPYDLQLTDNNAAKKVGNINEEGVTLYVLNVSKANVESNKEYYVQGYMWVRNSSGTLEYKKTDLIRVVSSDYVK